MLVIISREDVRVDGWFKMLTLTMTCIFTLTL